MSTNNIGTMAALTSASIRINEIQKRYPGNQTLKKDMKISLMITLLGLLPIFLSPLVPLFMDIEFVFALLFGGMASLVLLITSVIIFRTVYCAGLSPAERIILDEEYGQIVFVNGEAYFTEYSRPHTREEAEEFVNQYLNEEELSSDIHIYKLLDIKNRKTKKYKGKIIEFIGFTVDMVTNPVEHSWSLYSYKIPIHHDHPYFNKIVSLPEFDDSEEDILKDKKHLRTSFIITTVSLALFIWMPTLHLLFLVIPSFGVYLAWEFASNELKSHKVTRFLAKAYILLATAVGITNLALNMW